MGVIIPAILSSSRQIIRDELALLKGLVDTVQIDVVDGKFASPPTWPYTGAATDLAELAAAGTALPEWGTFVFEADLMVESPIKAAESWIAFGAQRILLHTESMPDIGGAIAEFKKNYGHDKGFAPTLVTLGVALGSETPLSTIEPYLADIDYVQLMGIAHVGKQGQPFDERVLEKITNLRRAHPPVTIQIDGGVSLITAPRLLDAGADRLVVGSALWRSNDIACALKEFEAIAAGKRG